MKRTILNDLCVSFMSLEKAQSIAKKISDSDPEFNYVVKQNQNNSNQQYFIEVYDSEGYLMGTF